MIEETVRMAAHGETAAVPAALGTNVGVGVMR